MLERGAVDQTPATGCRRCTPNRDALTGHGKLDVAAAVNSKVPPRADRYEPNDDAGSRAAPVKRRRSVTRRATIDFWNDRHDVYSVRLRRGERLRAALFGERGERPVNVDLVLWMPGARRLDDERQLSGRPADSSTSRGPREKVSHRARQGGRYFVHVKIDEPAAGYYTLKLVRE
jgi:hypothetical protein